MTNATLRGKPDAGNPHVRFDEGEVASAKARRGSLLYKEIKFVKSVTFLLAVFLLNQADAVAYVNDKLLFEATFSNPASLAAWTGATNAVWVKGGGPNGSNAVRFVLDDPKRVIHLDCPLDVRKVHGAVSLEADIRGENISDGLCAWDGSKVMLPHRVGKINFWPETDRYYGTYDWRHVRLVTSVPENSEDLFVRIGLENVTGLYEVTNIRIWSTRAISDDEVAAMPHPEPAEVKAIPRGPGFGTKYRGFMSGCDLSESAFETLRSWHANLMRFQFTGTFEQTDISSNAYLSWIDSEIARLDEVLPRAEKAGVKLVIDLHQGFGTELTPLASNVVGGKQGLPVMREAWLRIARHCKGNKNIYGYDLLNEPICNGNRWREICTDIIQAIRKIDDKTPIVVSWDRGLVNEPLPFDNVIYSPHFYFPHLYTHQGFHGNNLKFTYPGELGGVWWDKNTMRLSMEPIIRFQQKYKVPIYIGEFSCAAQAKGAGDYIRDCIALFEEYGWDWTYHAFRECPAWDIEQPGDPTRKVHVLKALQRNLDTSIALRGGVADDPLSYVCGQTATFCIEAVDTALGNAPVTDRTFVWKLMADDGREPKTGTVVSNASFTVSATMDKPGFVRLTVDVLDMDGKPLTDLRAKIDTSVGFDVEKIPEHPEPADFEAFWSKSVKDLLKRSYVPNVETLIPTNAVKGFHYCRYSLPTTPGERPATGLVVFPENAASNSCALKVYFDGYGFGPTPWPKAEVGTISACVTRHGENPTEDCLGYYDRLQKDEMKDFCFRNNDGKPEQTDFCKMLLRDVRALQYLKTLSKWNGRELKVEGGSMGGYQALSVAGLDHDVTFCKAVIPWCVDLSGDVKFGRMRGWRPNWTPALDYIDAKNLAKLIRCPVEIVVGLGDSVCPPSGEILLYRNLRVPVKASFQTLLLHGCPCGIENRTYLRTKGRPFGSASGNSDSTRRQAQDALFEMPWIGDGEPERVEASFYEEDPAPEFTAAFVLPQGEMSSNITIACAGYYTITLNGRRAGISQTSLMPLWSPFDRTIYADAFVGMNLKPHPETNVIMVTLGNGFYNLPPLRFWGSKCLREAMAHGRPCFKLSVGGVTEPLAWTCRKTNILRNCIYLGAEVDATREASARRPAAHVLGPKGVIVPRKAPQVDYVGLVEGRMTMCTGGTYVFDFGSNLSGVPCFVFVDEDRGRMIEIVYGERLNADGSVNFLTQTAGQIKRGGCGGAGAPCPACQRDVYVCGGAAEEAFEPPFVWHIGRYAEVRGAAHPPKAAKLKLVSSALRTVADPEKIPTEFKSLHEMCVRTFRNNLIGVQSDCPGRERLGYGGDIVATCEAMCLNFNMLEFYLKTLQDFADEAEGDGWITETAPYVGIADENGQAKDITGRQGPVSWALVVPVLIDTLLRHYPDASDRILTYYPVCARYARQMDAVNPTGIVPKCIGDHEALERAPNDMTATAHWYEFLRLTADFAQRLGKVDEVAEFKMMAEKVKVAFQRKYEKDGVVANGTQSAQAIALFLGLIPSEQVVRAEERLLKAIAEKGYALSTGLFSTRYMIIYLAKRGRNDIVRRVVRHKGYPGWYHMLERGATTLWETWKESDDVYSNCHPMLGSVDEWILQYADLK